MKEYEFVFVFVGKTEKTIKIDRNHKNHQPCLLYNHICINII